MTDSELLQSYVGAANQQAFAAIVSRHAGWVRAAAQRQAPAHLVDDVTQAVFVLLLRKAASLQSHENLGGWLFEATRFCAADARRTDMRRQLREMEAAAMRAAEASGGQSYDWQEIAPAIDAAVAAMKRADRQAIILRFYQGMGLRAVGEALGVTEEAARKRVDRALEKLRGLLQLKGITAQSAGLSAVLLMHLCQQTPTELARSLASLAAAPGSVASQLATTAGKSMLLAKTKVAAAVMGGTLLLAVAAAPVVALRYASQAGATAPPAAEPAPPPVVVAQATQAIQAIQPIDAIPPALVLPPPREAAPGRMVQVASKLDEYGRPVLTRIPLQRDLMTLELPRNDARSIRMLQVTDQTRPLVTTLADVGKPNGVVFRPEVGGPGGIPWNQATVRLAAGTRSFWQVTQELCQSEGLRWQTMPSADASTMVIQLAPLQQGELQAATTAPWGCIVMDYVQHTTRTAPPAWSQKETIRLSGWYYLDPSLPLVVVYPMKLWNEGKLGNSTQTRPEIVGKAARGSQISVLAPFSMVKQGVIPEAKGVLPLKLVHRTHSVAMDLPPGGNVAISIDGFVVHFFDAKASEDQVTLSYGMIRQPAQTAEDFAQFQEECDSWLERVEVSCGNGPWARINRTEGRGRTGDSMVWAAKASTGCAGGAGGVVKLRWELPAVVQRADFEFSMQQVAVP